MKFQRRFFSNGLVLLVVLHQAEGWLSLEEMYHAVAEFKKKHPMIQFELNSLYCVLYELMRDRYVQEKRAPYEATVYKIDTLGNHVVKGVASFFTKEDSVVSSESFIIC